MGKHIWTDLFIVYMSLYTHTTIGNNGCQGKLHSRAHNHSSARLRNASADQFEKFWAEEVQVATSTSHRHDSLGLHIIFLKPLFGNSLA